MGSQRIEYDWTTKHVPSLEKYLFRSSAHFSTGLFVLLLNSGNCLYILEIRSLSVTSFANIFSQSIGCLLVLSMVSFAVQKLICLITSHLFIFAFTSIALGDWPKQTLAQFMSENVLPMFSSRSFMVSLYIYIIFKSLSYYEFIFVYAVRLCSSFIDLHLSLQLFQHHLLKRLSFPRCVFLPLWSKINCKHLPIFKPCGCDRLSRTQLMSFLQCHGTWEAKKLQCRVTKVNTVWGANTLEKQLQRGAPISGHLFLEDVFQFQFPPTQATCLLPPVWSC